MRKEIFKKYSALFLWFVFLFFTLSFAYKTIICGKYFNLPSNEVVAKDKLKSTHLVTVIDNIRSSRQNDFKISCFMFSGAEIAATFTADEKTELSFSQKGFWGKLKAAVVKEETGEIILQTDDQNTVTLEKGRYNVYLIGKGYCGTVYLYGKTDY